MISEEAAIRAESWIEEAESGQARVICGGTRHRSAIEPTVISRVKPGMKVIDQEVFAPVVSVLRFGQIDEAVDGANNTPYGLATGIFSRDINLALKAARVPHFGSVHLNETSSSRADGMPYGGVKVSGFGQEGPRYAMREMAESA